MCPELVEGRALISSTPCFRLSSVAPSSPGSRPSPAGGLRPALTPAPGGAFQAVPEQGGECVMDEFGGD
jgi:hypothetical protein